MHELECSGDCAMQIMNPPVVATMMKTGTDRKIIESKQDSAPSSNDLSAKNHPVGEDASAGKAENGPEKSTYQARSLRDAMNHLSLKYDVNAITPAQVDQMAADLGDSLKEFFKNGDTQEHQDALLFILKLSRYSESYNEHAKSNGFLIDYRDNFGPNTKISLIEKTNGANSLSNSRVLQNQMDVLMGMVDRNQSEKITGPLSSRMMAELIRFQAI
jgi:hypothetical protein